MSRDPYADLPSVEQFQVRSSSIANGRLLNRAQVSGFLGGDGADVSPHLKWSGAPAGTRSFAVTVYDPDAPTASGFWHWAAFNITIGVDELAAGASNGAMPTGTIELVNDGGTIGYVGAAPPPGHGLHHYWAVVHAVNVDIIDISDTASPAFLGFQLYTHTLARAAIVATYETLTDQVTKPKT